MHSWGGHDYWPTGWPKKNSLVIWGWRGGGDGCGPGAVTLHVHNLLQVHLQQHHLLFITTNTSMTSTFKNIISPTLTPHATPLCPPWWCPWPTHHLTLGVMNYSQEKLNWPVWVSVVFTVYMTKERFLGPPCIYISSAKLFVFTENDIDFQGRETAQPIKKSPWVLPHQVQSTWFCLGPLLPPQLLLFAGSLSQCFQDTSVWPGQHDTLSLPLLDRATGRRREKSLSIYFHSFWRPSVIFNA